MEEGNTLHPIYYLLALIFFSYPWIAVSQSTLSSLPGYQGTLPFHLETGYAGVGDLNEDQLFYYFAESERNPKEDPLVLWLTGGPGCSAWSGLVYEIGPLNFEIEEYKGSFPNLKLNPYSWTKAANIIFLDQPVGTGFSYSRNVKDLGTGDIKSSKEIYEFLRKWFNDHPQFLSNPLYIGGDSYSGKTVPIVTHEISNANEAWELPLLNLKGYFVGNPVTDVKFDENAVVPFLHGMGIISDELYESVKINCKGDYINPSNEKCYKDLLEVNKTTIGLNENHILEPTCSEVFPKPQEMVGKRRSIEENSGQLLSLPPPTLDCRKYAYLFSFVWANDESVRKALGIHKGSIKEWIRCQKDMLYKKEVASTIKYHQSLTSKGYRALIYSGDHDLVIPFVGTQAWIRSLNSPIVDDWRSWSVDGQIAGYTRTYANHMTFATIKGAGHTGPEYKPKEGFAMFQRWISDEPL